MPDELALVDDARRARILVVDDEAAIRDMLMRWLRCAGHCCRQAAGVNEALEVLQQDEFDLVITDHAMPGRTGLDLIGRLHQAGEQASVILLTGCDDPRLAAEAMTRGASGYLVKPLVLRDLLHQVARLVERRRRVCEARRRHLSLEASLAEQERLVRDANEELIHRLVVASMLRDDETGAHIKRIGWFSAAVAEAAGWETDDVERIRLAASMHDIGKIGIPDSILLKPGRLSREEFETMKRHALIGAGILEGSRSPMLRLAEQIARSHHEWWNGAGYPDGLAGTSIPEAARIVAVVDVYDALTHDRVYRPAMPEADALEILAGGRSKQFDPDVLDVFFGVLPQIREIAAAPDDMDHFAPLRMNEPVARTDGAAVGSDEAALVDSVYFTAPTTLEGTCHGNR